MKLLDLFCCAGGGAVGYSRAGFEVVGVDKDPQPHYPFEFHQADAFEYLAEHYKEFDVIHASPPCRRYSSSTRANGPSVVERHPHLIPRTRAALMGTGKPYIIENVFLARKYLDNPILLCGTMFGLNTIRHRVFELKPPALLSPMSCNHFKPVVRLGYAPNKNEFACVVGNFSGVEKGRLAMGIDWMTRDELKEAIPPVYTEWIGRQPWSVLHA